MRNTGQSYHTREDRPPIDVPEIQDSHRLILYVDRLGVVRAAHDRQTGDTHTIGGVQEFRRNWEAVHAGPSSFDPKRPDLLEVIVSARQHKR